VKNIIIILAEVSLVILVFGLVNWLVGRLFKQLLRVAWFQKMNSNARNLRRNLEAMIVICCIALCLVIVGGNGWLIYRGKDLKEYTLGLVSNIPKGFWITLGTGLGKCICLLMLVAFAMKPLQRLLNYGCVRAKKLKQITASDESIEDFFSYLTKILTSGLWLLSLIWCTQFLKVPESTTKYLYVVLNIYLIIGIGLLILRSIVVIIDSIDNLTVQYSSPDNILRFYSNLRHLIPFFKRCLEYIIYVTMATLVVEQVEIIANLATYGSKAVKIIGIIFLSRGLIVIANVFLEEALLRYPKLTDVQRKKRLTIIPVLESLLKYLIYFGSGILILDTIEIDATPILAGAGIVGLAVGLGAQNLINDMVSGFFILFENYYLVGDYIQTGEAEGIVEAIELRTTRIRHFNGQMYIIRNGDIGSITNYSKDYIYAVVEVGIEYDADLDQVYRVIEKVGHQLQQKYSEVLEPTKVDGIEDFGDFDLSIRTITKVKPGKHHLIKRVIRKMIKDVFEQEGIELNAQDPVFILKQ